MNILITGCAGFIGFHLVQKISNKKNINIIGIDIINAYYDVNLKLDRLNIIKKIKNFKFYKIDINNNKKLEYLFKKYKISLVVHLAAQAGVRYSILNPKSYVDNNIYGFFNILEAVRKFNVKKIIYASSSSVYGSSDHFPTKEKQNTDEPKSFYAATKKCNEIFASSYSSLYKIDCIGLRFFTVYGPFGRPDMSLYKFVDSIYKNKKVEIYNFGNHQRDFTYIDDVINSLEKIIFIRNSSKASNTVYNVATGKPISLRRYLTSIEKIIGRKAKVKLLPFQKGDAIKTHASNIELFKKISYKPSTDIMVGLNNFIEWYKNYNNIN